MKIVLYHDGMGPYKVYCNWNFREPGVGYDKLELMWNQIEEWVRGGKKEIVRVYEN